MKMVNISKHDIGDFEKFSSSLEVLTHFENLKFLPVTFF